MNSPQRAFGTIIEAKTGRFITRSRQDLVSRTLFIEGMWEPLQVAIAKEVLRDIPSPTVLDVGCNLGAFSIPIGEHLLVTGGSVHSFDAQRAVFYQACGACALNGLDNIFMHNLAVGDKQGQIDVPLLDLTATNSVGGLSLDKEYNRLRSNDFTFKTGVESVPMITLDTFLTPAQCDRLVLMKVDVEGFELEVFLGASQLLLSQHPTLIFEAWEGLDWYKEKRERLLQHIRSLGYLLISCGEMILAQHHKGKANMIKVEFLDRQVKMTCARRATLK